MTQSRTLCLGLDSHIQDHGAKGSDRGTMGTRQDAIAPRVCTMPSKATHLCRRAAWRCLYVALHGACQGLSVFQDHPTPLKDWLQRDAFQHKKI